MESSFFDATVTRCTDSKVTLMFSAFDMGNAVSYSFSWLNRFATRVLPQGSTLITREIYELHEASGNPDLSETYDDVFAIEDEDEVSDPDWDMKYSRKRTLRSHKRVNKRRK